ncbi:MAG: tRNA (N(6)-L-threonylcarbamoyladenosine(37)-C(2))-methylthiotransferase MtaB [Fusicatenibacter sp.]|nr:tRNA (N(6)-L-threonylcarbamoyladenosine(37)-C(2))-methylthiotransferase MtaB [Fusicatenibacter sp.]
MKKKVALHNLGCKVNAYELEAIQQMLEEKGFEIVPFASGADAYIINTCTVTNIADRKSRQMLHKAKKMNPDAVVVACGCYVQAAGEKLKDDETIDLIVGNNRKKDLAEILESFLEEREEKTKKSFLVDMTHNREYEELSISRTAEHTRAFLKVQDGCNQFCTYCIIPFARGRVRSRRPLDVVEEVRRLSEAGYQEVVLTGIHLSSYGVDFPEGEKKTLLDLIRMVHKIEGIKRIRLGSLEPGIITEEFARGIAVLPKVCPHFHLSLQSGSDGVLKRMNRRYTAAEYREKCEILRSVYDNPALTTDVIVGFPGESAEEFEESRAFVEEVHFFETHIFKYSRREGTRAAVMDGQIPEQEKTSRSHVLLALDEQRRREYMESFLGKEIEVLMEEQAEIDGITYWTGHTREYLHVAVLSEENLMNQMRRIIPQRVYHGDYLME